MDFTEPSTAAGAGIATSSQVSCPRLNAMRSGRAPQTAHKQHINKKPNLFDKLGLINGGETGIRTLGGIAATIDFESIPFGHSGISPRALILTQPESGNQRKSRCRSDDWLLNRQPVANRPPSLATPRLAETASGALSVRSGLLAYSPGAAAGLSAFP